MKRTCGPKLLTGAKLQLICPSICSPHYMRGGSFFLSRSLKVALPAPSAILNGVSCELMTPYSCMLGTAFTTPHTSANCASAMPGERRQGAVELPSHIGRGRGTPRRLQVLDSRYVTRFY